MCGRYTLITDIRKRMDLCADVRFREHLGGYGRIFLDVPVHGG